MAVEATRPPIVEAVAMAVVGPPPAEKARVTTSVAVYPEPVVTGVIVETAPELVTVEVKVAPVPCPPVPVIVGRPV
jgi:hypothetical protein